MNSDFCQRAVFSLTGFLVFVLAFFVFGKFSAANAAYPGFFSTEAIFCESNSGTNWQVAYRFDYADGSHSNYRYVMTGSVPGNAPCSGLDIGGEILFNQWFDNTPGFTWWTQCWDPHPDPIVNNEVLNLLAWRDNVTYSGGSGGNNLGTVFATDSTAASCPATATPPTPTPAPAPGAFNIGASYSCVGSSARIAISLSGAVSPNATSYEIYWLAGNASPRSGSYQVSIPAADFNRDGYVNGSFTPGVQYSWDVRAVNSVGGAWTSNGWFNPTMPSPCGAGSPPTVTLTASPTSISSGGSSTLSWTTTGSPTGCTASASPANGNWSGAKSTTSGSTQSTFALSSTTTFYIYCTNASGNSPTASATVTVGGGTNDFTLTGNGASGSTTVSSGTNVNMIWTHAAGSASRTSCSASSSPSISSWNTAGANTPASGSLVSNGTGHGVAVTSATTLTMACNYASGTTPVSRQFTINISAAVSPPTVSLTASPTSVASGGSSTLSWTTSGSPTSCDRSSSPSKTQWNAIGISGASSNLLVTNITATTIFTITCHKSGVSDASANATVTVTGSSAIGVSLTASPTSVASGGSSTLSWTTSGSPTSCDRSSSPSKTQWNAIGISGASSNLLVTNITATTIFTITCHKSGVADATSNKTVTLGAGGSVPTVTLTANPTTVASGGSSTLTWTTTNSPTSCTASGGWSGAKAAAGGSQTTGLLSATTTFYLYCTNASGSSPTVQAVVTVSGSPLSAARTQTCNNGLVDVTVTYYSPYRTYMYFNSTNQPTNELSELNPSGFFTQTHNPYEAVKTNDSLTGAEVTATFKGFPQGMTFSYRNNQMEWPFATYSSGNQTTRSDCAANPSNLTVSTACTGGILTVNFAWTDNATNESGYYVDVTTGSAWTTWGFKTLGINSTSTTWSASSPLTGGPPTMPAINTVYYWRVQANGGSSSDHVYYGGGIAQPGSTYAVGNPCVPSPPSGLIATASCPSGVLTVNFTWADNATNETNYYVDVTTTAAGWGGWSYKSLAANSTSFAWSSGNQLTPNGGANITSPAASTSYYFRVNAYNGNNSYTYNGGGAVAPGSTFSTGSPCVSAPTNLSIDPLPACSNTAYSVTFRWTGVSASDWGISISRPSSALTLPIAAGLQTVTLNSPYFLSNSFDPGVTFNWAIRYQTVPTTLFTANGPSFNVPLCAPANPSNLRVSTLCGTNGSRMEFRFTDNATNETAYYIATTDDVTWNTIDAWVALPPNPAMPIVWDSANTWNVTATPAVGARYYWRVQAQNIAGSSSYIYYNGEIGVGTITPPGNLSPQVPSCPDLDFGDITNFIKYYKSAIDRISDVSSISFDPNATVYARIIVRNNASVAFSTPFRVAFYPNPGAGFIPPCGIPGAGNNESLSIGGLAANGSSTWDFTFTAPATENPSVPAKAFADNRCEVGESNEINNVVQKPYSVQTRAWFETTGGDVGANQDISQDSNVVVPPGRYQSQYLLIGNPLSSVTSSAWKVAPYTGDLMPSKVNPYTYLKDRFWQKATDRGTCGAGIFSPAALARCTALGGTWTTGGDIPAGFGHGVMFIDGNLVLSGNLRLLGANDTMTLIVSGNITVNTNVTQVDGVLIAGGTFTDVDASGSSGSQLVVNGNVYAGNVVLARRLISGGSTTPAESFRFVSKYILNLVTLLGSPSVNWTEVAP